MHFLQKKQNKTNKNKTIQHDLIIFHRIYELVKEITIIQQVKFTLYMCVYNIGFTYVTKLFSNNVLLQFQVL